LVECKLPQLREDEKTKSVQTNQPEEDKAKSVQTNLPEEEKADSTQIKQRPKARPRKGRDIPPDGLLYALSPGQLQAAQAMIVMGGEGKQVNERDGKQVKKGGGKSVKAKCSTKQKPYEQNQANEKAKPAQIKQIHNINQNELNDEDASDASQSPTTEGKVVTKEDKWEAKFEELLEFKKKHGHVNIPSRLKENQKLSHWVCYQRQRYRRLEVGYLYSMTAEQIDRLNEIGELYANNLGIAA
jgi:hypothetical protein